MRSAAAIATAVLALLSVPVHADERITDFASDIRVSQTGALTVTETISVNSEDVAIRHGIFRDFPTIYDREGRRTHVGFDVLSASLDGHDEPYSVVRIAAGERVKIGDPKAELAAGPHRFTLVYATDRQIRFLPEFDELYWNATGNFWAIPIDQAEATVELPDGANITQFAAYTGRVGSTAQNAQAEKISGSAVRFSTTAALGSQEGLTIAVGFSKGAVIPPSPAELRRQFIQDNAATIVACAGVLLMLIYFVAVWVEFGRRPQRGVIVPLFAPPKGFSPASVRFVHRMGYDGKAYAASLIDMAVKGFIKISEDHGVYTLTRTGKSQSETGLADGESAIAGKLFTDGDSIELKQINHDAVAGSTLALKTSLTNEYERNYFVTNSHWFIGGIAMLGLTGLASAVLCDVPGADSNLVWIAGACFGTAMLGHRAFDAWRGTLSGPGSRAANAYRALSMTGLFSLAFVASWLVGVMRLMHSVPLPVTVALCLGGVAAYVFYYLLKHPTLLGAKIIDEIDGFEMFLATAEKDRLEALNPPDVTPEIFEKFLPYAIALDCGNQWSRRFEAQAAATGMAPDARGRYYAPGWYSGASFDNFGAIGFAGALGASIAAAAALSSSTPGSGGGGFSGGGGGGGGGGGW